MRLLSPQQHREGAAPGHLPANAGARLQNKGSASIKTGGASLSWTWLPRLPPPLWVSCSLFALWQAPAKEISPHIQLATTVRQYTGLGKGIGKDSHYWHTKMCFKWEADRRLWLQCAASFLSAARDMVTTQTALLPQQVMSGDGEHFLVQISRHTLFIRGSSSVSQIPSTPYPFGLDESLRQGSSFKSRNSI